MKGQESEKTPVRTRCPLTGVLRQPSAATFFGPSQARDPCPPLALFHPRGVTAPQWHQVLWVTGAWVYCGCIRWSPHLLASSEARLNRWTQSEHESPGPTGLDGLATR